MSLPKQIVSKMEGLRHSRAIREEHLRIDKNDITESLLKDVITALEKEGYNVTEGESENYYHLLLKW